MRHICDAKNGERKSTKINLTVEILLLLLRPTTTPRCLQLVKSPGLQNDVLPLLSILRDSSPQTPSFLKSSSTSSTHLLLGLLLPRGHPMNTVFTGPVSYTHLDVYKRQGKR